MIGADLETSTADKRRKVAEFAHLRQVMYVGGCIETVAKTLPRLPETIILSGVGEFLAQVCAQQSDDRHPLSGRLSE